MAHEALVIAAVGDVMVDRDDPLSILTDEVRAALAAADIRFGVLETAYSDKGSRGSSGPRGALPHDPKNYVVIPEAGFDIITIAGNHMMDWGEDALLDCIDRLRDDGIEPIGAGRDLADARRPVILERNGTRIGFLSYCSVAPKGYYAAEGKSGVAPMRAITH